jgi:pimeloyl-ACP methyl ester carboxylesterase
MKHLLLLHGAIGAKDQLIPLGEKLNGHFYVHMLNFSGHGGQPIPDDFSIRAFADDVLRYLDDNKIAQVSIFGYSMGGYVALFLARYFPEKVNQIFTLATKFDWTPEIAARETGMLDAAKIAEKIPAFANQLEGRHHPVDWKQLLQKTAVMMCDMGDENPLKKEDFEAIDCPVLVGIGDSDTMVSLEESISVYRLLPKSNLIVLPKTQHPIEKIDIGQLTAAINNFFI